MNKQELAKIRKLVAQTYENYTDGKHEDLIDSADGGELMLLAARAINISEAIDKYVETYHSLQMKVYKRRMKKLCQEK